MAIASANFYWVEPTRLAAGPYPAAPADLAALIEAGIGGFIDLTAEAPYSYAAEADRLAKLRGRDALHGRFPIVDFGIPEIAAMRAILDAIDAWIAAGRPVYVHCHAGIGRTGTVIACHLIRRGLAPGAALAEVQRLRRGTRDGGRPSPETDVQRHFVEAWRNDM